MDRVWLHNAATGGYFHCPADAVEAWAELGWEPGDAPVEVNLATAERIGWEQHQKPVEREPAVERPTRATRRQPEGELTDG